MLFRSKLAVAHADVAGMAAGGKAGCVLGAKLGTVLGSPITGGVFGAFLGGVIGGAYSSWLASPNTRAIPSLNVPGCSFMANECMILVKEDLSVNTAAVIVKDDKILERLNVDEELLERVNLDEECLTVGSIHNILLSSLDGSVVVDSNVKNESLNIYCDKLLNSKEFINECKWVGESVNAGTLSDDLVNSVISLFNDVCLKSSATSLDVVYIINEYVRVVDATDELTDIEKKCVKYGLATALYSYQYWGVI